MKERPILFSGAMVRAILEGRKSQTRRVVKGIDITGPNPPHTLDFKVEGKWKGAVHSTTREGNGLKLCPHGQPGDLLWVRETWFPNAVNWERDQMPSDLLFAADGDYREQRVGHPWKPSIFMPRWASRLTLRISKVRVERLQECSETDAIAEGIEPNCDGKHIADCPACRDDGKCKAAGEWLKYDTDEDDFEPAYTGRESYQSLWESINGKGSWDLNPWVWVIEFERVEQRAKAA